MPISELLRQARRCDYDVSLRALSRRHHVWNDSDVSPEQYEYDGAGGYKYLTRTRGWKKICGARLRAQTTGFSALWQKLDWLFRRGRFGTIKNRRERKKPNRTSKGYLKRAGPPKKRGQFFEYERLRDRNIEAGRWAAV